MKKLVLFLVLLVMSSCNNDDTYYYYQPITNVFAYDNDLYRIRTVIINDENIVDDTPSDLNITLTNKSVSELEETFDLTNINSVSFAYTDVEVLPGTLNGIFEYTTQIGGNRIAGVFSDGIVVLQNGANTVLNANNAQVKILSKSATEIHICFEFTRTDGEKIVGEFCGPYLSN
jgi:hypothetical protein